MSKNKIIASIRREIGGFSPKMGIIAGSGLGALGDILENKQVLPYQKIEGFIECSVQGHAGEFCFGTLHNMPIVCLKGRLHYYEGVSNEKMALLPWTLCELGCDTLLITNAAGGIRENLHPGDLMVITDHINFQFKNVLAGLPISEKIGSRFISLDHTYDQNLRQLLHHTAATLNIRLSEGVYLSVLGPSFETPAEIRAFKMLGADAVGMSTVPEAILARYYGMRVVGLSVITNKAAGLQTHALSHEETLASAKKVSKQLVELLAYFIKKIKHAGQ
jgi:inosine/guanosine/xanthosine phosphorylase family protein